MVDLTVDSDQMLCITVRDERDWLRCDTVGRAGKNEAGGLGSLQYSRLVAQIEFLEWTGEPHLRHSRFVGLREDKKARDVKRE